MRLLLIVFVLMLLPAGEAAAIFYNNTETIEVGDGSLPEASPDSTNDTGSSGGSTNNPTNPTQSGTTGTETNPQTPTTSDDEDDSGEEENEGSVVEALIQAGALSGVNTSSSGTGSASGAGGTGFTIRVIGAKVRQALSADIDLREILTYWRKGKGQASGSELGLIAASTALRDANVQEVAFTASSFEIVYRSRGYLLAIIPWSFPVRVTVISSAPTLDERIAVKLPWYRFFVRKFFTVKGLQRDIDELITKTKNENTDGDIDETALLFEATAQFLRTKVGTVADSVLLGAPQQ